MYHKFLTLFVVLVAISLIFILPNDAFGVNTLKNVINFTGTYPAGVDEFDVTLSTSVTNKSKAFSFITFRHATDNDASASFRSWEMLQTDGFTYNLYKTITINATEVDENITLYPHLLNITDTDLRDDALANGDDIIFTDNTGTTQFAHEIEDYDGTTGTLVAWVGVPNVSSTVDTTYRMYYNSPTATNTEDSSGVWDSDFLLVQHLDETGDGTNDEYSDSTSNDNAGRGGGGNATRVPDAITTPFAKGQDFVPSDDNFICPATDNGLCDNSGVSPIFQNVFVARTWSMWYNANDVNATQILFEEGGQITGANLYIRNSTVSGGVWSEGNPAFYDGNWTSADVTGTEDEWTYLVLTFDSGTADELILYINGQVAQTITPAVDTSILSHPSDPSIGAVKESTVLDAGINTISPSGGGTDRFNFNGTIDEFRVSSIARSSDYIATTFCDQQANSICPFDSVGSEVSGDTFTGVNTVIRIYGHSGTPANNDALDFVGYVIEYTNTSDLFVQHENFTLGASATEGERFRLLPTAINSSSTMILPSGIDFDGVNAFIGSEEFARYRIVNNTHWGWIVNDTSATGDNNIFAQIIDWNVPTVRVQTGNTTMLVAGSKTVTQTPPIAVQNNQTMFFASYTTAGATDEQTNRLTLFMMLQEDGDMVFNRDSTNFEKVIQWQLVEFLDSTMFMIHNGTCTAFGTLPECDEVGAKMAIGETTFDFPIPTSDTTTTIPFSPNAGGFGFSQGRGEGGDRGRIDNTMVTMELTSPTNVRMTRGASTIDAGWGMEVITWGNVFGGGQAFEQDVSDSVTVIDLSQNMNITKIQTDTTTAEDTVNANAIFVIELSDTGSVLDVTSLNITKLNTDLVSALDETNFNISIGLVDTATILDLVDTGLFTGIELLDTTNVNDDLQFAITKALTDLSSVLDDPDKDIDKTIADITTIIDQAEPEVIREILELDTVTANDEVRLEIIKAIIDVIANSDEVNFSVNKILTDIVVVSDLIDSTPEFGVDELDLITANDLVILDVTKQLSDVASVIDDLNLAPSKVFLDTTTVTDQTETEQGKVIIDPIATVDDIIIDVTKLIQDISAMQDQVVVLKVQDIAITDTVTVSDPSILFKITKTQTGGGGGGSGTPIPQFERIVGLFVESELFHLQTTDRINSDFKIQWFGQDTQLTSITRISTEPEFSSWLQFSPTPDLLDVDQTIDGSRTINDPARFVNFALDDFVIIAPSISCDQVDRFDALTTPCLDPILYQVPVEFEFTKGGVKFHVDHIIQIDARVAVPECNFFGFEMPQGTCEVAQFGIDNWVWFIIIFGALYFTYLLIPRLTGKTRNVRRAGSRDLESMSDIKVKRKFKRGRR